MKQVFMYKKLKAFNPKKEVYNVIIETPKGSRNKFAFKPRFNVFELTAVLTAGSTFPYDFGFFPSTLGEDGDPLDVLLLMDERAFPGCLVHARLVGVIKAEQEENGKMARNDRLIAVAEKSYNHSDIKTIDDINENLRAEIEHFFTSFNEFKEKKFKVLGWSGVDKAKELIAEGEALFKKKKAKKSA